MSSITSPEKFGTRYFSLSPHGVIAIPIVRLSNIEGVVSSLAVGSKQSGDMNELPLSEYGETLLNGRDGRKAAASPMSARGR